MVRTSTDVPPRESSTFTEPKFDTNMADDAEFSSRRGIELMTRHSIHSIASMGTEHSEDQPQLRKWNLKVLRDRFERNDELLHLYKKYQRRLMMSVHLQSFLLLQIIVNAGLILLILLVNLGDETKGIPELIADGVQLVLASLTFWYLNRRQTDRPKLKKHSHSSESEQQTTSGNPLDRREQANCPEREENSTTAKYELIFLTTVIIFFLIGIDFALGVWFMSQNHRTEAQEKVFVFYIPTTLYIIIVIYNFLPIRSLRYTTLLAVLISIAHVSFTVVVFHKEVYGDKIDENMIIAEVTFYAGANLMGIFMKSLNEITLRRAFLDKRKCLETTLKLNYEKSQEEKLMISILPEHIASKVSKDIWNEIQAMDEESGSKSQSIPHRPFNGLYVEKHREVSILYADIVNFTPLTASQHPANLVAMLNELFGKFDEAAQENNCLRIKILGDCYYCVSGIHQENPSANKSPSQNHAKNCVEMGFKMIDIIRDVRDYYGVEVEMRIGIHSGSIISGLLGIRKWQYDIWSRDVTIANHMEQSGLPGRVHISMATKVLAGDSYEFEDGSGKERDAYLKQNDITTFLVKRKKLTEAKDNKTEQRRIKFLTPEPVRSEISTIDMCTGEPFVASTSEEGSLDSLYEVYPEILPVTIAQTRDNSGSHANVAHRESIPGEHLPSRTPSEVEHDQHSRFSKAQKRKSGPLVGSLKEIEKVKRRSTTNNENHRRGAVWMDTALRDVMTKANEAMEDAIQNMHLSKFSNKGKSENTKVNFLLLFKDRSWEIPFLLRPDLLFGSYIIGAVPVIISIFIMQFVLYNLSVTPTFWWSLGVAVAAFFIAAIILWGPFLWRRIQFFANRFQPRINSEADQDSFAEEQNRTAWSKMEQMRNHLWCRIIIFLIVCSSIGVFSMASMEVTFQPTYSNSTTSECRVEDPRIYVWYFTYSCALAMTVVFGFYRINFFIKLIVYSTATIVHSVFIYQIYPKICEVLVMSNEECLRCTASLALSPELSHTIYLVRLLLLLHVADRQIEFIHRLDFIWQQQLISEQKQALTTRTVNKLLLRNILPHHVAEIYLDRHHHKGLYHEDYKLVAVMFASIPHYMDCFAEGDSEGMRSLEVLNDIISGFDALLYRAPFQWIEKIKIVGSTYMAACGLKEITKSLDDYEDTGVCKNEEPHKDLVTMVYFGAAMEQFLEQYCLRKQEKFHLRIGISYGPVVAGVVGAEKPLYDIWGDTVNMASRLEYTGEVGKIHVTQEVASYLQSVDIPSMERGETFLKGKGHVKTSLILPSQVSLQNVSSLPRASNVSMLNGRIANRGMLYESHRKNKRRITEEVSIEP